MSMHRYDPTRTGEPADWQDLRLIASRQKGVLYCILFYILGSLALFMLPPDMAILTGLLLGIVFVAAFVYVFLLASKLYGAGVGVVLALLTLVPLVGLIVLLVVNQKATKILTENGVKVGFMGAHVPRDA